MAPVSPPVDPGQSPGGGPGGEAPEVLHFTVLKNGLKIHVFPLNCRKNQPLSWSFEFYSRGHCTVPPNQNVNWNSETSVGVFDETLKLQAQAHKLMANFGQISQDYSKL